MSSYNESNNESFISSDQLPQSFSYLSGKGFDSGSRKSLQPLGTSGGQKRAKSFLKQGLNKLSRSEYGLALKDFKQALRIDPNFIEAYICQSIVYYYQEDYQEAITVCNRVLQINPNNVDAYNNRGLNRCAMGEYKEAIADFNQVLAIDPHHAKAFLNRGYSRMQVDDNWAAIEDFDQALRLDPTSARVYLKQLADTLNQDPGVSKNANEKLIKGLLIQGNLRYEAKDYQEAIAVYTQVLNLDPTNTEAHNRRSTALSAVGEYEAAFQDLYQAADAYLSDEQSLLPQTETTASDEQFLLPQTETTLENANFSTQPLIKTETTVEELNQQGVTKLQQGDFWGAIEAFNQILERNKNDAKALVCRGLAYRQLADNLKAIADLERAVQLFFEQGDFNSSQQISETLHKLQA
jgi:tetratricopeptide (TPR) repeat protein